MCEAPLEDLSVNAHTRISQNVLAELSCIVAEGRPSLSTERGDLFASDTVPLAVVRLEISAVHYLAYLTSLPLEERPSFAKIVPADDLPFYMVINGFVSAENGQTTIKGDLATIL